MGKSDYIYIDKKKLEKNAYQIKKTSDVLCADILNPCDSVSTLVANNNLHRIFEESQTLIVKLGEVMDEEISNIHSLGVAFEQFDSMLADLGK